MRVTSYNWNFFDFLVKIIIEISIGFVLANLIEPKYFGYITMVSFITWISEIIVNSGSSQFILKERNLDNSAFNTIFYYNIIISVVLIIIVNVIKGKIIDFYNEKILFTVIIGLNVNLFINALTIVPRSILSLKMKYKEMFFITIVSLIMSSIVAIFLALNGNFILAILSKNIVRDLIQSVAYLLIVDWFPKFNFNIAVLKQVFNYSYTLIVSGILTSITYNLVFLLMGRRFGANLLGEVSRAELFAKIIGQQLTFSLAGVYYIKLAKIRDRKKIFNNIFKIYYQNAFVIISFLLFILFINGSNVIPILLGENWNQTGIFIKYFCLVMLFYPVNWFNLNVCNLFNKPQIYLKWHSISDLVLGILTYLAYAFSFNPINFILMLLIHQLITFLIYSKSILNFHNYLIFKQLIFIISYVLIYIVIFILLDLMYHNSLSNVWLILILDTIFSFLIINVLSEFLHRLFPDIFLFNLKRVL